MTYPPEAQGPGQPQEPYGQPPRPTNPWQGPQPLQRPPYAPQGPHPPQPVYIGQQPGPKRKAPIWAWIVGGLVVLLIISGLVNGGSKSSTAAIAPAVSAIAATPTPPSEAEISASAAAQASARAAASASASAAAAKEASARAAASASSAAAAAAKEAAATQKFSGKGADVVTFKDFGGQAVIITLTHTGSRNFAVWSVDAAGQNVDLLTNTIGKYSGTVPLNFTEDPAGLKITADGAWTATTAPVSSAPRWDGTGQYSGKGDAVVIVSDAATGLSPVTITNSGERNFVVYAWGPSERDLLVNQIGNYSGRHLIPKGTVLLSVESAGTWTIAK